MNEEKIEHWVCDVCNKQLTRIKDEELEIEYHFDISRSKKDLTVEENEIVENLEYRNEKMLRMICKDCFDKILNESKTLGELFFSKYYKCFIY